MCVIISGDTQPDTTKLMNIPVVIDNEKYNFFMYINNLDLYKNNSIDSIDSIDNINNKFNTSISISNDNIGNFAKFQSNDEFYSQINNTNNTNNPNNSIMVVPFPVNPHTSSSKIGLVDISTNDMKTLRNNIKLLKPIKNSANLSRSYSAQFSLNKAPLEVHQIGNYNISVATSLDQLLERIDWTKFKKPANFKQRVDTFRNHQLYPYKFAYFYVVASAIKNIKDDGFGIVYPELEENITYIPTAHEDIEYEHKFDVEIYNFNYKSQSYYKKDYLHNILEKLKNQPVKMINNTYKKMSFNKNISSFEFIEYTDKMKNFNLFLHKN